jgi:UDP-glucose 4-epimerase
MKAWITGASGYIGTCLRGVLGQSGWNYAGLDIAAPSALTEDKILIGHRVDEESLGELLTETGAPDIVYHLAGGSAVGPSFADPAADFRNSVATTCVVLDFLRRNAPGAVTILTSSAAIYGNTYRHPIAESETPAPFSPYGAHKLMVETLGGSYAAHFGMDVRIVRPFSVYGAGLRKQLFWDLCGKLKAQGSATLGGTGNETRDFVHGEDVAEALRMLASAPREDGYRIVNIASGEPVSIHAAASLVADTWSRETGKQASIAFSGSSRPGDPESLIGANKRLLKLGFRPKISLESGLADYVRWYLQAAA